MISVRSKVQVLLGPPFLPVRRRRIEGAGGAFEGKNPARSARRAHGSGFGSGVLRVLRDGGLPDAGRTLRSGPLVSGGVAQLGERRLCKPEVIGSIPFASTTLPVRLGRTECAGGAFGGRVRSSLERRRAYTARTEAVSCRGVHIYRVRYSLDPLCGHEIRGDVHRRFVAVRHGEEEEGIVPSSAWGDPRRSRRHGAWNMTR